MGQIGREVAAMTAAVDRIGRSTESMDVEALADARDALGGLRDVLKTAMLAIDAALLEAVVEPQRVGERIISQQPKRQMRADHGLIRDAICMRAQFDPDTGAEVTSGDAAQRAATMVFDAYVTRSATPRRAVLRELQIDERTCFFWEETGVALKVEYLG